MSTNVLDKLFPTPKAPASPTSPRPYAGHSPAAIPKLLELLKDNHEKYHTFHNDFGFHNHVSHHLLALYQLGAAPEVMEKWYQKDSSVQRAAFKSPETITDKNLFDHVGDEKYYTAYKEYFTKVVLEKGAAASLEEYVFAKKANVDENGKEGPMLLCRLLAGLVHPMIHTAYGFEFGLPGMVVEGLAQTYSTHLKFDKPLFRSDLFVDRQTKEKQGVHAFTILSRMMKDPQWDNYKTNGAYTYGSMFEQYSEAIRNYADQWSLNLNKEGEVESKAEELIWMNVVLYVVSGWKKGQDFASDFFFMHLVTSSLFLPTLLHHLQPSSQALLLRSYLTVSLGWLIAMGRPVLDIKGFYQDTSILVKADNGEANPWFPILKATILHSDDHLAKLQRALAHYSSLPTLGGRKAGLKDFESTELEGAALIDGSLFLRGAKLTMMFMGGEGFGQERLWDGASM